MKHHTSQVTCALMHDQILNLPVAYPLLI